MAERFCDYQYLVEYMFIKSNLSENGNFLQFARLLQRNFGPFDIYTREDVTQQQYSQDLSANINESLCILIQD